MKAEYKDIPGYPGYRAGTDGSIWSRWERGIVGKGNRARLGAEWWQVPTNPDRRGLGYPQCNIRLGGRKVCRKVHRLVLEAFVGPRPPGKTCCRHRDGNPANNTLANLEWGTFQENSADRLLHGTDCRGERHGRAQISEAQAREILELRAAGMKCVDISRRFEVSRHVVGAICRGVRWKHLNH